MTSTIVRQSAASPCSTGPSSITPALLTSTSRRPRRSAALRDEGAGLRLVGDVDLERPRRCCRSRPRCGAASASMRSLRRAPSATAGARAGERERGRLADPRRRSRDRHRLAAHVRHAAADSIRRRGPGRPRRPRPTGRSANVSSTLARSSTRRAGPGGQTSTSGRSSRARKARARSSACSPDESRKVTPLRSRTNAPTVLHTASSTSSLSCGARLDVELAGDRDRARAADLRGAVSRRGICCRRSLSLGQLVLVS